MQSSEEAFYLNNNNLTYLYLILLFNQVNLLLIIDICDSYYDSTNKIVEIMVDFILIIYAYKRESNLQIIINFDLIIF